MTSETIKDETQKIKESWNDDKKEEGYLFPLFLLGLSHFTRAFFIEV